VEVAREVLAGHAMSQPQARVCALMARIEDAAGDKGRAREWLARAIHATRDPMWVSDGVANARWVPVSPVTGDIVPCDWKVPFDMPPPTDQLLGDATQGGAQAGPALAAPGAGTRPDKRAEGAVPPPRMPDDPGIDPDIDPGVAPGEERDAFAG
jgi:HemY protein